jgi:hypothetical protein
MEGRLQQNGKDATWYLRRVPILTLMNSDDVQGTTWYLDKVPMLKPLHLENARGTTSYLRKVPMLTPSSWDKAWGSQKWPLWLTNPTQKSVMVEYS